VNKPGPHPSLANRLPSEGINSSDEHPLKEFAWLLVGALVTLAVVIALIGWGVQWLAPKVPFRHEVTLAKAVLDREQTAADAQRSAYLQALANRVAATMRLPSDIPLVVQFTDESVINAYATIGGRIRVYRGLLEKLPSEEALAALLAHEIAHVKHRHVAASMGRGLALTLLFSVIGGDAGAQAAQGVLGQVAGLALMGYSREQETLADTEALQASAAVYGHVGGYASLFAALGAAEKNKGPSVAVLRSHPLTETRLAHAQTMAQARGWAFTGSVTPLPPLWGTGAAAPAKP
jgi:beta-barrel assembly-enhancing protease